MPRRIKEESEEEWDENEEDTDSEEEEIRPTTIARKVHNLSKSNGSESEVESEYEEGSSESEYEGEPRSKRRKTSSGVNMRGILEDFKMLPAELVLEIASYLDLKSIYSLYRVNRTFHDFFAFKSHRFIWTKARARSGIPTNLEAPFNDLALANLLFGTCCQECGKFTSIASDLTLRVRYCRDCSRELLTSEKAIKYDYTKQALLVIGPPESALKVPSISRRVSSNRFGHFLTRDEEDLGQMTLTVEQARGGVRAENCRKVERDGVLLNNWRKNFDRLEVAAAARVQKIKEDRFKEIEKRFVEEGWEEVNFDNSVWKSHYLLDVSQPLTEEDWPAIRKELLVVLKKQEGEILKQSLAELRQERWDELYSIFGQLVENPSSILHPLPPFEEFAHFKSIKKLWDLDDTTLDADTFELAIPDILSELIEKRKIFISKQVDGIIELIQRLFDSIGISVKDQRTYPKLPTLNKSYTQKEINSVQNLALARIRCKSCKRSHHLSQVFFHQCSDSKSRGQASLLLKNYSLVEEKELTLVLNLLRLANLFPSAGHEELIKVGNRYGCDMCEENLGTAARTSEQIIRHVLLNKGRHKVHIIEEKEIVETLMRISANYVED